MSTILEKPRRRSILPFDPNEPFGGIGSLRRFTVAEYHKLIEWGYFDKDRSYELLEAFIVHKWRRDDEKTWGGMEAQRRFTVAEYHQLIERGFFGSNERLELLDGYLVLKMPRNTPHDSTFDTLEGFLLTLLPAEFFLRVQRAITLETGEPEPDIAIVRGPRTRYQTGHPTPTDIALVIEISDTSLRTDKREKVQSYAEAGLRIYWIVNLPDRQIEVFAKPNAGSYESREVFGLHQRVPLIVAGVVCGTIPVADVLPHIS